MSNLDLHEQAAARFRAMALANAEQVVRSTVVGRDLSARLTSISDDHQALDLAYEAPTAMATSFGALHGGTIASVIDEACSFAAFAQVGVHCFLGTAELAVSYHRRLKPGHFVGHARIKARSARSIWAEADILQDGELAASGRSLMLIDLSRPIREAWVGKAASSDHG